MTKVMRKEARHTQRQDRASGVPLEILEHIPPKPESAYFLLVLSPKPLTLRGALPHYLSLLLQIKFYWNPAMPICLHTVNVYFCAVTAELNSHMWPEKPIQAG